MARGNDMERYIMNKIDEVYKKVEKIESTLADIQQVVIMTNNALAEHISNSNKEREREDWIGNLDLGEKQSGGKTPTNY